MGIVSKATLKTYFETGDKPTEAQFVDVFDSLAHVTDIGGGGGGTTLFGVTLTAGDVSCFVRYTGDSAPTLTENSVGNYTLDITAGCTLRGFDFTGDNTTLSGGELTLILDSADADLLYFTLDIINLGNNQVSDLPALGITVTQVVDVSGTNTAVFPNMSGFGAAGYTILGRVA